MLKNYWTYIKESSNGLTKLIICIHSIEDYNVIAEFLDFEGFTWGEERVKTLNKDYNCFKNESPDFCFILHEPGALGYGRKGGLIGPGNDYNSYDFMEGVDFIDEYINDNKKPTRVRWYKKGKLNESKEFIGKRVKMKEDCPKDYLNQAYGFKGGDSGCGVIQNYNPYDEEEYDGLPYTIKWDNGHVDSYARKHFYFMEDLEPEKPVKIRWYKKGKLLNEGKDDKFKYGDICLYIPDAVEVEILEFKAYMHVTEYRIKFKDGNTKWVPETLLLFKRKGGTYSKPEPVERIR